MKVCDPVTLEIIRGAIRAAQAEMEALIERTAISAFIREKKDFYTALFDADGVMCVGSNVPVFGDICGPVFAKFPIETIRPGDLYWYNDCYGSRGAVSHSNDQVFLAPVFHEGRRVAFVMGWAHFSDIGGIRPGSISPDATDIFQEGIIIPPTKLIDQGVTNEATLEIFYRNSRYPATCRGDTRALMASVELGIRRMGEIAGRFGPEVLADTRQSGGGEDFSWYLEDVPGAMARLGVWSGSGPHLDLHQPTFDIDERALAVGVRVLVNIIDQSAAFE